jgi:hypothetical protein
MKLFAALLLAIAAARSPTSLPQSVPERVAALDRILVLGASLSHGYGLEREVGASVHLSDVVEASLRGGHEPVRSQAALLFFVDPLSTGRSEVAASKTVEPTLVVGIDFLFWFGYGAFPADADRMAMLDKGLALLEVFSCPVMVGDFPDVADASRDPSRGGEKGRLLGPEQVPQPETLKKLNGRLHAWASTHPNVVVVPLGDLVARLHSGKDVEVHGNRWSGSDLDALIQKDRLHPTLQGAIALWLGALEALVASKPEIPASAFDWDAKAISKRIYDAKAKERPAETPARTPARTPEKGG